MGHNLVEALSFTTRLQKNLGSKKVCVYNNKSKWQMKGVGFMRNRYFSNREALGVKIDYVESKLDESIKNFRESMLQMEQRHNESLIGIKETIEKIEARIAFDREASEARLSNDRKEAETRLREERERNYKLLAEGRKESRATRRALNANFIAVIVLIITIVGIFITVLNGSLVF